MKETFENIFSWGRKAHLVQNFEVVPDECTTGKFGPGLCNVDVACCMGQAGPFTDAEAETGYEEMFKAKMTQEELNNDEESEEEH